MQPRAIWSFDYVDLSIPFGLWLGSSWLGKKQRERQNPAAAQCQQPDSS
jgi:hypothetical protein